MIDEVPQNRPPNVFACADRQIWIGGEVGGIMNILTEGFCAANEANCRICVRGNFVYRFTAL